MNLSVPEIYRHISFKLPMRRLDHLFPGILRSPAQLSASLIQRKDFWPLPILELLTLGAICQQFRPRRIFEIGTYRGASTLTMAMNTPPETQIWTLDLAPEMQSTHVHGLGVGVPNFPVGELYRDTSYESRIHQLYGNSQVLDFSPYYGSMDLVLIDADHTYEFVKTDTEVALKLLKPGGMILWDDYLWIEQFPECAGVTRCLDELSTTLPCFQIAETRLAMHLNGFPLHGQGV
ncbi:MAG: class I SAM-dependent methyltransferase [Synechococcales bacterium]|nr:class I SAM-dependent methyltransferase [Synechococcales bacterium]